MKTKIIFLILIALCFINNDAIAQRQKGKDKSETIQNINIDSNNDVDSLQILKMKILSNDSITKMLKDKIKSDSVKYIRLNDSLLAIINAGEKEIKRLETELENEKGFVDTCMVKLANRWLYEKFDKENVEDAIKYFDRIYSSKLKSELSIVQILLREYEKSYKEFQSILREAQNDGDRISIFAVEDYKNKYKQKIENMPYYKKYYDKSWTIRYLDEQIKKALETLGNHTKDKHADFDYLIDKDFQ